MFENVVLSELLLCILCYQGTFQLTSTGLFLNVLKLPMESNFSCVYIKELVRWLYFRSVVLKMMYP